MRKHYIWGLVQDRMSTTEALRRQLEKLGGEELMGLK
jgi:hypothetical protein